MSINVFVKKIVRQIFFSIIDSVSLKIKNYERVFSHFCLFIVIYYIDGKANIKRGQKVEMKWGRGGGGGQRDHGFYVFYNLQFVIVVGMSSDYL